MLLPMPSPAGDIVFIVGSKRSSSCDTRNAALQGNPLF